MSALSSERAFAKFLSTRVVAVVEAERPLTAAERALALRLWPGPRAVRVLEGQMAAYARQKRA